MGYLKVQFWVDNTGYEDVMWRHGLNGWKELQTCTTFYSEDILGKNECRQTGKKDALINIPKEVGFSKCENYRGITLLCVAGKIFNSVAEPVERFTRRPVSKSTVWVPWSSVMHGPYCETTMTLWSKWEHRQHYMEFIPLRTLQSRALRTAHRCIQDKERCKIRTLNLTFLQLVD